MRRPLLTLFLAFIIKFASAQSSPKDTLIYNLPVVNDKLVYTDTVNVKGRDKATLGSIAKKWLNDYFTLDKQPAQQTDVELLHVDTAGIYLNRGIIEYKTRPGMVNITFLLISHISISCKDNVYRYTIDRIKFRPKSNTLNQVGYQNCPDLLIRLYKQKHFGMTGWVVTRGQIRDYLANMNKTIRACIASLNKAMAN